MSRGLRRIVAALGVVLAGLATVAPVAAHPLGNFTVNRAIAVAIGPSGISLEYVIDMAEIPAFAALEAMDADRDGHTSAAERGAFATASCRTAAGGLSLEMDGAPLALRSRGEPALTFPPGAGGLETLRLVCPFASDPIRDGGEHRLTVADRADDGHLGWHEVIIGSEGGVRITSSNVPDESPSLLLTTYPADSLDVPVDVRSGEAAWRLVAGEQASTVGSGPNAGAPRSTAADPLAALVAGDGSLPGLLLGLLLAVGLGALHAISPGHGKTLVAAYLLGSGGTIRQAAGLGLTVAVTHTAGVFLLGLVMLGAGQLLVPERVIGWLSAVSGLLMVGLGIGLVLQAIGRRGTGHSHELVDGHAHEHSHEHGGSHPHAHAPRPGASPLRARNVIALGFAGGMVPSASALIVLLVAVSTGRLLMGMTLIIAFGIGMAAVLGGLAVATTWLRGSVRIGQRLSKHRWVGGLSGWLPLASGMAVAVAGAALAISAVTRLG